jgi:hypothetical protein
MLAGTHVGRHEMSKGRWVELLVDEITNVTDNNQDEVTGNQLKFNLGTVLAYLMYVVTKTK